MAPTNPTTDQPESTLLEPPSSAAEGNTSEAASPHSASPPAAEPPQANCPPGCTHSRLSAGCVRPCHGTTAAPSAPAGVAEVTPAAPAGTPTVEATRPRTDGAGESAPPAVASPSATLTAEPEPEPPAVAAPAASPAADPQPAPPPESPRVPAVPWPADLPHDEDVRDLTLSKISETARRVADFVEIQPEHPNAPQLFATLASIYNTLSSR